MCTTGASCQKTKLLCAVGRLPSRELTNARGSGRVPGIATKSDLINEPGAIVNSFFILPLASWPHPNASSDTSLLPTQLPLSARRETYERTQEQEHLGEHKARFRRYTVRMHHAHWLRSCATVPASYQLAAALCGLSDHVAYTHCNSGVLQVLHNQRQLCKQHSPAPSLRLCPHIPDAFIHFLDNCGKHTAKMRLVINVDQGPH